MYQTTPSVSRSLKGMGNELIDGSGTINPAALDSSGMTCLSTSFSLNLGANLLNASYKIPMYPSNCMDGALSQ
jgi:hypothetical protein